MAKMSMRSIFKAVVLIALASTVSVSSAAEGTWKSKADMATGRLCPSTCVVDGKIYVIGGGRGISGPYLSTVEVYDPVTDTWTPKADMHTARNGHAAVAANGKIYVLGGEPSPQASLATMEEYDPATDTWKQKADLPTRRTFLSACTLDGKIYAFGGVTAGLPGAEWNPSTLEVYDPATDTWATRASMPIATCVAGACVANGKIYVMGGVNGGLLHDPAVSTVQEYDPATNAWTRKPNMPTARAGLSLSEVGGRIYAIGGGTYGGPTYSTVEEYDPATDTWTPMPDMPTARLCFSTGVVNGRIYAIGGARDWYPGSGMSTVEEYDPNPLVVDFNGDGIVDIKDLLQLIESWGQANLTIDIGPRPFGDGIVDEKDLEIFIDHWGEEPGLVAKWKLDETEGTIASDSAGVNDGTVIGVPAWQPASGKFGGALFFDGATLLAADMVLSPADGPFSVFTWVKGGAPGQALLSQVNGANWLMTDMSGALMTELKGSGRNAGILCSEATIADDQWHCIGLTWDGSIRRLFVDDILVAEGIQNQLIDCRGGLNIGCGKDMAPDSFWTGLVDEVRIYNRTVNP
jgi:N-acetylneuraminic acid mutarotase